MFHCLVSLPLEVRFRSCTGCVRWWWWIQSRSLPTVLVSPSSYSGFGELGLPIRKQLIAFSGRGCQYLITDKIGFHRLVKSLTSSLITVRAVVCFLHPKLICTVVWSLL